MDGLNNYNRCYLTCNLSDCELKILYILYHGKNFKSSSGYHSDKLKHIIDKKFPGEFDVSVAHLKNLGCIAEIRKKEIKYYISDKSNVIKLLGAHGFNVTKGKFIKL